MDAELVEWAAAEAKTYLASLTDRWLHTQEVATAAKRYTFAVPEEDRRLLVAAAWVHDIGHSPQLAVTGFHPLDGAVHLRDQGHEALAELVAYHTGARHEAKLRGLDDHLSKFSEGDPVVAAFLTFCDLTNGPHGKSMTVKRRLEDVAARYGIVHPVTRGLIIGWDELDRQVATAQHLRAKVAMDNAKRQAAEWAASPWVDDRGRPLPRPLPQRQRRR